MNKTSWYAQQQGQIQLGAEKEPSTSTPEREVHGVPKAALEKGTLQLLALAAEMQQRQDLDSALQLYQAAMEKVKSHGLNRRKLFHGTWTKPPPLNSRTPLEWCLHLGDIPSAICLLEGPNNALATLRRQVSLERVEQILDAGAEIEYRIGPKGRTLLLQEAAEGRYAGVRLALDRGASVSCMDDNGETALALALRSGEAQTDLIFTDLVDAHADLHHHDGQGHPLFKVALAHAQPEALTKVITALSPLTVESRQCMQDWAAGLPKNGNKWTARSVEVLRLLLGQGLDPNLRCLPGLAGTSTLLEMAMRREAADSTMLVAELLEKGAEPMLEAALHHSTIHNLELILTRLKPLDEGQYEKMVSWLKTPKANKRDHEILKLLLDIGVGRRGT
ncbi:hypothetical protein MMC07_005003 [Pseudocyphellaria aurata]|nr:hypothetical protein [Pseudocyphellaria aurata]